MISTLPHAPLSDAILYKYGREYLHFILNLLENKLKGSNVKATIIS